MGDLVPGWPWSNLPHAARLYCRKSHPPVGETFSTKNALDVELLRQVNADSEGCILAVCDGAYAAATVVGARLEPGPASKGECDAAARGRPAVSSRSGPGPRRDQQDGRYGIRSARLR